ncbi:Hypothetical protein NTJ_02994 [Nesidiocoris tenuis]|uniref:Tudor domain-containing protein n=1 Tax=Nesidiocoris tenuis TaxID=355587 RepID=A0ABN7AD14_9HEMI|nr:Hypothetical protein NTJ_02994 [Nesidiocoris tenuis]
MENSDLEKRTLVETRCSDQKTQIVQEEPLVPRLSNLFQIGVCQNCGSPSMNHCCVCKAWFCSYPCIEAQWSEHRLTCSPKKITILSDGCVTIDDDIFSQRVGPKVTFNLQPVVIPDVRKPKLEEVVGEPWRFQVKRPVETVQKDDGSVVQKEIPSTNAETHAAHAKDPLDAVPITHNDRRSSNDEKQLATCSQIDQHFSRHNPVDAHLNTYTQCQVLYAGHEWPFYYVCLSSLYNQLVEMTNKLTKFINEFGISLEYYHVDLRCAALYYDEWYRAEITSILGNNDVSIIFIDYGNEHTCQLSDLRVLPDEFNGLPPFGFKILLTDSDLKVEENTTIGIIPIDVLEDGTILVQSSIGSLPEPDNGDKLDCSSNEITNAGSVEETVERETNPNQLSVNNLVELEDGTVLVQSSIGSLPEPKNGDKLDCSSNEITNAGSVEETVERETEPNQLAVNNLVEVTILFRDEPDSFWVVNQSGFERLQKIGELLENHCKELKDQAIMHPEKGSVYCSNYDGIWCRAQVVKTDPCMVTYIDYGNTEEIDPKELRSIPVEIGQEPGLAMLTQLLDKELNTYSTSGLTADNVVIRPLKKVGDVYLAVVEAETDSKE